jgi:bifunctional non-homologous end joining protein LigD
MGLEGIVLKRLDSRHRSGRSDQWRKIKSWTESQFVLVGTELDSRSGAPIAILARENEAPCTTPAAPSSHSKGRRGID